MPLRTFLILLVAVAVLAGCGRRGSLEPPGEPPAAATGVAPAGAGISPLDPGAPAAVVPSQPQPQQAAPPRRFLLDFLL